MVAHPTGVHRSDHQGPGVGKGNIPPQGSEPAASEILAQRRPDNNAGPVHHPFTQNETQHQCDADGGLPVAQPQAKVPQSFHRKAQKHNPFLGHPVTQVAHHQPGHEVDGRHRADEVRRHLRAHSLVLYQNRKQADQNAQRRRLPQAGANQQQPVCLRPQRLPDSVVSGLPPGRRRAAAPGRGTARCSVGQQPQILRPVAEPPAQRQQDDRVERAGGNEAPPQAGPVNQQVHRGNQRQPAQRCYRGQDGNGQGAAPLEPLVQPGKAGVLEGHAVPQGNQSQIDHRESPEGGHPEGHYDVAGHCDDQGRRQHFPVAELVNQPAGRGAFQPALGPRNGKYQVRLRLGDAQLVADGQNQHADPAKENAAGKEAHYRSNGNHPPAIVNARSRPRRRQSVVRCSHCANPRTPAQSPPAKFTRPTRRRRIDRGHARCPTSLTSCRNDGNAGSDPGPGLPIFVINRHSHTPTVIPTPQPSFRRKPESRRFQWTRACAVTKILWLNHLKIGLFKTRDDLKRIAISVTT